MLSDILFQVEDAFFNMNNIDKSFELAQDTPMYAYCDNFSIIDRVPHIQKLKDNYYKVTLVNQTNNHEQIILKNKGW